MPWKVETDGRVFPVSDSSQSVIDVLTRAAYGAEVEVLTSTGVKEVKPEDDQYVLIDYSGKPLFRSKALIVCTGGAARADGLSFLSALGLEQVPPVPSLFTFNLPGAEIRALQGLSVPHAEVSLPQCKRSFEGPLLITHWGLSGPVVLKLSAFCARQLAALDYDTVVRVNFLPAKPRADFANELSAFKADNPKKQIGGYPSGLPARLWQYLLREADVNETYSFQSLAKSQIEKLCDQIFAHSLTMKGKTTFKDEFVTCGGISPKEVDMRTMACKTYPGLVFAGEVLDIDGVTGGFNFQAAWTTGYLAGTHAAEYVSRR
jgi:predicted Rossmann fold flavoprotein